MGTGPNLTWEAVAAARAPGPTPAAESPRPTHLAPAPHSPARTAPAASAGAGRRRLYRSPAGPRGAGESAPLLLLLPPPPLLHPQRVLLPLLLPSLRLLPPLRPLAPPPPPPGPRPGAPPSPKSGSAPCPGGSRIAPAWLPRRPSQPLGTVRPGPPTACLPPSSARGRRARAAEGSGGQAAAGDLAAAPSRCPSARELFTSGWKDGRPGRPGRPGPAVPGVRPRPRSLAPDGATAESGGPGSPLPPDASGPRWPRSRRRARTLAGPQTHTHPTHTCSSSPSAES